MPLGSLPLASLLAALLALASGTGIVLLDVATDASGQAEDAAAKGAVATPLFLALLFAVYFALGRALVAGGKPTFARAASFSLVAALILVSVPAGISISYGGGPLLAVSTYTPWVIGVTLLLAVLLPGSLLQAWLLGSRHNKSLERTRDR
jgi:hypothetical protein